MADIGYSLVIDPNIMDEAAAASSNLLSVPEHINANKSKVFWPEVFEISKTGVTVLEDEDDKPKGRIRVGVWFKVAADSPDTTNVGRTFYMGSLINPSSLRDKASKERTMTIMSLGKLSSLLRAAGFDIKGTAFDLAEYFGNPEEEEASVDTPPVGAKVIAVIKQYTKDGEKRQDIQKFDDLSSLEG